MLISCIFAAATFTKAIWKLWFRRQCQRDFQRVLRTVFQLIWKNIRGMLQEIIKVGKNSFHSFWFIRASDKLNVWSSNGLAYEIMVLSVTSRINFIVARWPDKHCLSHCMYLYQVNITLLFWMTWSIDTKIDNYIILTSLKSESTCKRINRIPGLRLDIKFTRLSFENAYWIARQASRFNKRSQALPGKLDIKRCSPSILYVPHLGSHACNMYGQLSSEGSLAVIGLNHHLYPYFKTTSSKYSLTTSSKCSCETVKMYRLIWTFTACRLDKYQNLDWLGPVAQSVASPTADIGAVSSIPARSHTFVEIDHEIISMVILLLLIQERLLSVTSKSMCMKYWLTA